VDASWLDDRKEKEKEKEKEHVSGRASVDLL